MSNKAIIMPDTHSISYSEGGKVVWEIGTQNSIPNGMSSQQFYQKGDVTLLRIRVALKNALSQLDGQISLMPESP
jgi:hypothetical protein